jgi:hypothetical protein
LPNAFANSFSKRVERVPPMNTITCPNASVCVVIFETELLRGESIVFVACVERATPVEINASQTLRRRLGAANQFRIGLSRKPMLDPLMYIQAQLMGTRIWSVSWMRLKKAETAA